MRLENISLDGSEKEVKFLKEALRQLPADFLEFSFFGIPDSKRAKKAEAIPDPRNGAAAIYLWAKSPYSIKKVNLPDGIVSGSLDLDGATEMSFTYRDVNYTVDLKNRANEQH